MNGALWKKNYRECRWLLLGCCAAMFAFQWVRVWLVGQIPLGNFKMILQLIPSHLTKIAPVPVEQIATPAGRIAAAFDEPLVIILATVWGIARGSDAVSGEIGRGTMEMLLAQPVRRLNVLGTQAATTIVGAAMLAASAWCGTSIGLAAVHLDDPVAAQRFVPCALNLFALTTFIAGLATLVSSCDRYRARTIGIVGAVYVVEMVFKIIGRVAPGGTWLTRLTFLTLFEPQALVASGDRAWSFWVPTDTGWQLGGLGYDGLLLGMAGGCYLLSAVIFARRDLPAPL